jgi:hypothetical protein
VVFRQPATLLLLFSFQAKSQDYPEAKLSVSVSVYNDAELSAAVVAQAEQRAAKTFKQAGVDVMWTDCSVATRHINPDVRAGAPSSPGSAAGPRRAAPVETVAVKRASIANEERCDQFTWPAHLGVRITPHSSRSVSEIFGAAFLSLEGTGCYSDVFYDNAMELHRNWNVGLSDILGNVIAHELGHLLLGSNSHGHIGIMKARWEHEELYRLTIGNLFFTNKEADHIRRTIMTADQLMQPEVAVTARSQF